MGDNTNFIDQSEEDILAYEVSDDALERAAGKGFELKTNTHIIGEWGCCPP